MKLKEYHIIAKTTLSKHYEDREAVSLIYRLFEDKYGIRREDFIINPDKKYNLGNGFYKDIDKLCQHIPIQHITGFQDFMGLRFRITKSTLIPRPETEQLVSIIADHHQNCSSRLDILDIGTGSGVIAISLAKVIKDSNVIGIDISKRALNIANDNAKANDVNINFIQTDFISGKKPDRLWDIIVSNPPYIPERDKRDIPENVLGHDPDKALFVSNDNPLIFYSKISEYAFSHLKTGGRLYFEINEKFGLETLREVQNNGFSDTHLIKDIFGKDRFIWSEK